MTEHLLAAIDLSHAVETFEASTALLIFFAYIIVDSLYTRYTLFVTQLNALGAASTGSFIYLLLAFGTISYVENFLYVFPLALGSWLGTFFTLRSARIRTHIRHHFRKKH